MIDFPSTGDILNILCEIKNIFLTENHRTEADFLNVMGMIGIALLTVMIPVALVIVTNRKDGTDYEILDQNVVLEHIVKAHYVLVYLFLIYFPILLWGFLSFSSWGPQILAVFFWSVGVFGMVRILINTYHWLKGDNLNLRLEYLRSLQSPSDLEKEAGKLWRSVWAVKGRYPHDERKFFIVFSSTIDNLLKVDAKNIRIASELVNGFNAYINKRPIIFLIILDEVFSKILEWHFLAWKKRDEYRDSGDNILVSYSELYWGLSSTLKQAQERAWKEKEEFSLFRKFESHIEKCKADTIEKKYGKTYIESVMSDFFNGFLENVGANRNVWGYFPPEWRITEENIKGQKNQVVAVLFKAFMSWARDRISNLEENKYDGVLDDVIRFLFPNVCPMMWAKIIAFLTQSHWGGGKRMKSLIEQPINFGGVGRVRMRWGSDDDEAEKKREEKIKKEREDEEEETINLASRIEALTEELLKECIVELKAMEGNYSADSSKEFRRQEYIDIFEKINARRKENADK